MYGNTIQVNHPLVISGQEGYQFSLTNVALDPDSQVLFVLHRKHYCLLKLGIKKY